VITPNAQIRPATAADADALAMIYNHFVLHTMVTFEEDPVTGTVMAERMRDVLDSGCPYLVAERDGVVVGYAYATKWKPRVGYRFSTEVTVYLAPDEAGRGIGSLLYGALIPELRTRGFRNAIGGIGLPNAASVRLHERMGFVKVAEFPNIGIKFGSWMNVGYWQLEL
jgi:L-amino acid N-acyltransferase YncA